MNATRTIVTAHGKPVTRRVVLCDVCGGTMVKGRRFAHMLEVYECQQCEHSVHPELVEVEVKS